LDKTFLVAKSGRISLEISVIEDQDVIKKILKHLGL